MMAFTRMKPLSLVFIYPGNKEADLIGRFNLSVDTVKTDMNPIHTPTPWFYSVAS